MNSKEKTKELNKEVK